MMTLKTFVFLASLYWASLPLRAQSGADRASRNAIHFADSLNQAFHTAHWNEYIALSYPGVVKYYGGVSEFLEHVAKLKSPTANVLSGHLEVVQILNEQAEWQCVVRKTDHAVIDGTGAEIISYLVGQSKDGGSTWTYVDVASNSPENVVYIMPDIFEKISIPQRQIIFEKATLASKD